MALKCNRIWSQRDLLPAYPLPAYLPPMSQSRIRNFCIVAHIDHGKSTLADRLIEATGTVQKREMRDAGARHHGSRAGARHHDQAQRGADELHGAGRPDYELNLIDTPGHVDFTYEVSRSLAACEGAILVVDASQGIQAQTLSNLFLAMDAGLEIIPVLNKIDLPGAEPERRAPGDHGSDRRQAGGDPGGLAPRRGPAIPELLEAIVARVPPPRGKPDAPLRALIFDSYYDRYRGAIPSIRVVDGVDPGGDGDRVRRPSGRRLRSGRGRLPPAGPASDRRAGGGRSRLRGGQRARCAGRAGRATPSSTPPTARPSCCPAIATCKSMVFAGLYPTDSEQYERLRDALEKLRLNDA